MANKIYTQEISSLDENGKEKKCPYKKKCKGKLIIVGSEACESCEDFQLSSVKDEETHSTSLSACAITPMTQTVICSEVPHFASMLTHIVGAS
jgi:hypothetical protein